MTAHGDALRKPALAKIVTDFAVELMKLEDDTASVNDMNQMLNVAKRNLASHC